MADDENRSAKIEPEDEMFQMNSNKVIGLGKDSEKLNLILMIPKSNIRSFDSDVSLSRVLNSRLNDPEAVKTLAKEFMGKNSHRLKEMSFKVDIFCLTTGRLLCSDISTSICDVNSKTHGSMDLYDVTPLRSCSELVVKLLWSQNLT